MKILYLAPLPPPITGHSIAAQAVLDYLLERHTVEIVNLSEGSLHNGTITLKRIQVVATLIWKVFIAAKRVEKIYLTISESIPGNIKDLFFYFAIRKKLGCTIIHLHGGSFGQQILDRSLLLRKINHHFLSRIGAAIVSGPSHREIFGHLIPIDHINVVPNFAKDNVFVELDDIEKKFSDFQENIRILYISGMTHGKGYQTLLEAYERLSDSAKTYVQLDFAGRFDNIKHEKYFLDRIALLPNVNYHGVVLDEKKTALFAKAHIFVLPTSFMEGQPISILEAYASGCVVLTTSRPGIQDIFDQSKNGFFISSDDSASLCKTIELYSRNISALRCMAYHNYKFAFENYREHIFCERVEAVLKSVNC